MRLVKVAKELNVGTNTIVDYLNDSGFEVANKPTSKISDEMYDALLKEFQASANVKEAADKLIIGNRTKEEEEVPAPKKTVTFTKPTPTPPPAPEPTIPEPAPVVEEPVAKVEVPEPVVEEEKVVKKKEEDNTISHRNEVGPKVLGKIDLTPKPKKPKAKAVKEKPKAEKPKVVAPKEEVVEAKTPPVKPVVEKPKAVPPEMLRAETPELKGLKVVGKINMDKITPKKKPAADNKSDKSTSNAPKRKRKRKKVSTGTNRPNTQRSGGGAGGGNQNRGGRGNNRRPPAKEKEGVSQKEVDDKIKATMAKLSGGGKKKRQKIRRGNRDEKKVRREEEEKSRETGALQLTEFVSVSELASLMDVPVTEVITTCMNLGVIVSINQRLDAEVIELVASEFDFEVEFISAEEHVEEEEEIIDNEEDLVPRSPIVTVMGHVDHGKTSLLDHIRKATVADGEAGGITQHIGAYEVKVGDKRIAFLDTPGHEAFTAMRARGAKVTDVAVIIIAADDRIMPQTKEAISHAQAAGVPIVFAINKIDKDGANPDRIKTELAAMNLQVEEWGGKYQSQDISAKMGQNVDKLLEKILLEAEMLELKANPKRAAIGTVIEASLDKGRGYVCKILVQNGSLEQGDPIIAGGTYGKVKAMFNEHGKRVKKVGPATPVLILGLDGAPQAGEIFKVMESEQEARQLATKRAQINREQANRASKRISLDEIGRRLALGTFKELNLIVKGDVDGSIEALSDALQKQSIETVQVNIIHKAVGQIIESDVLLASASDAIIIGFQVRPSLAARKLAEREGVEIKMYSVIYEAIDEIRSAIEGMLEPTKEEKIVANIEVRETYKISKIGTIAGCYVTDGNIKRNSFIRIIRDGIVIYPTKEGVKGEISSLKRFKDDVKEVKFGFECGITIKNYNDLKEGDVIEGYEIIEIAQKLN